MRTAKQAESIFFKTPGAWFGNMPECHEFKNGNVTVDLTKVVEAVKYLKRFYTVKGTRASRESGGIVIDIETKEG